MTTFGQSTIHSKLAKYSPLTQVRENQLIKQPRPRSEGRKHIARPPKIHHQNIPNLQPQPLRNNAIDRNSIVTPILAPKIQAEHQPENAQQTHNSKPVKQKPINCTDGIGHFPSHLLQKK